MLHVSGDPISVHQLSEYSLYFSDKLLRFDMCMSFQTNLVFSLNDLITTPRQ